MQDLSKIEHVFVLMMENRSFDHTLGALALEGRAVDGVDLAAERYNLDAGGQRHPVAKLAPDWSRTFTADPPHGRGSVKAQIEDDGGNPMGNFVKTFAQKFSKDPAVLARRGDVMKYLDRSDLPVSYFFADHFASCQAWFCPVPTGTIPNRLYSVAGHSAGIATNPKPKSYVRGIPIKTVFGLFDDWQVYTGSLPVLTMMRELRWPLLRGKMRRLGKLSAHLREAEQRRRRLPKVIWIEPTYYWTEHSIIDPLFPEPNDDHPPSDTLRGQLLLAELYQSLTTEAPSIWQKSALFLTYDEHGGFYDHVTPPPIYRDEYIPADGFTRRGPRVPTQVISPFTAPGSFHGNTERGEFYDHNSLLQFLSDWLGRPAIRALSPRVSSTRIQSAARLLEDTPQTRPPSLPPGMIKSLKDRIAGQARASVSDAMSQLGEALRRNLHRDYPNELAEFLRG